MISQEAGMVVDANKFVCLVSAGVCTGIDHGYFVNATSYILRSI